MKSNAVLIESTSREEAAERLRTTDDATLALCALCNDRDVWREFLRRFEPLVRASLARTLAAGQKFLPSDALEDALGWYWVVLLRDDREWLRRYDSTGGATLASWLRALAWDVGTKYLRIQRKLHLREQRKRIKRRSDDADEQNDDPEYENPYDALGRGALFEQIASLPPSMLAYYLANKIPEREPEPKKLDPRFKWR